MDKFIGKKLDGRYEIQALVGIGGMANVYKAWDTLENRMVAVKILREEYIGNEEFMRRFRNESKAIAVLSHPNIVRVYDVSLSDRMPSIVMEFIDGVTLKDYIEQQRVIGWKEAVHFTVQILRGLQHAHDNGIVHRDIKPQNMMLLSDGTIKITDFGIARFSRAQYRTITDRAIGSVHYISPEQARGENTDQKTDIYSVGVMLFEMLTGRLPFEADSPVSVAIKQIESEPPRLRELNPAIPEGLEEIIVRAMQKNTERRYQSAAEMLRDIDNFKNNPTINFEYKYLAEPQPPKRSRPAPEGVKRVPQRAKSNRAPVLPVLTGITIAFVLATIVFVATMVYINNPFKRVEDVDLPNLVGMKYDTVKKTPAYTEKFNIQVEVTEPNDQYEKGVIFQQYPNSVGKVKLGSTIKVKVSSGSQIVTLPGYAGQEATLVFSKLKELGLEYTESSIYSDTIQEGYVVRTDPDKNTQVPTGSNITVYVSRGSNIKMADVPDVTGLDVEDAKRLILNNNFKYNILLQESDEYDKGEVIRQDPGFGSMAPEGSMINLTVSAGDVDVRRLQLLIALPTGMNELVTLTAVQDGVQVREERVIPSEARVWRPAFQGEGESKVTILLDDKVYQRYTLDFDMGGHFKTEDNSESFGQ